MLEQKLMKKLLVDQRLSDLVVLEQEVLPQILQKNATSKEPWLVAQEKTSWTQ